ncbi:MAG: sigma-70 family RNA polymerase sigma factor [Planctomycetota bacterium]
MVADLDDETFERLVAAHQAELTRYLVYLGAEHALAEDLVQETFLTVLEISVPPFFGDPRRRRGWLRGIARNLFLRQWERSRREPLRLDPQALELAEDAWSRTFAGDDGAGYLAALQACAEEAPGRSRQILDLRYRQQKSRADMAAALSMTENGVKSALRRIRERLRDCVQRRLGREGR